MKSGKNLEVREGYLNRHIDGLPGVMCNMEVIVRDVDGEHVHVCRWEPYDRSKELVTTISYNKPAEGYLGCVRVIEGRFEGIGFNVWAQNNSEFVYYKVLGEVSDNRGKGVKFKYRTHCGSLDESMRTVKEYSGVLELVEDLNRSGGGEVLEVKTSYCMYDERVGWETYYVLVMRVGDVRYIVEGMSDCKINWESL